MDYLYRVGQRVCIVDNTTIHHYSTIGQIARIQRRTSWCDMEAYVVSCETTNGMPTQVIIEHDLRSAGAEVV